MSAGAKDIDAVTSNSIRCTAAVPLELKLSAIWQPPIHSSQVSIDFLLLNAHAHAVRGIIFRH